MDLQALRRLRAIVDDAESRVRIRVEQALDALCRSISLARLEQVLSSRDPFAIYDLSGTLPARLSAAADLLSRVYVAGGLAGMGQLRSAGVRIGIRFDA